ncbi:hypothetical protein I4F81_008726 [Pyropia yezoensis]|uniref:Uncharacterized protein n=1 Tax=Pyropia yezoensis TaxID=2788 RepID=A0ACC3C7B9_PYRYE|nr:hypothetical protein I4F81_008726 [Neopyropia yezoensis]
MASAAVHPSLGAVCGLAAAALRAAERALRVLVTALLWLLAAGGLLTTLTAAGVGSAAVPVVLYVVRAMASSTPAAGVAVAAAACSAVAAAATRLAVSLAPAACGWTTRAVGAAPEAAPVVATTPAAVTRIARTAAGIRAQQLLPSHTTAGHPFHREASQAGRLHPPRPTPSGPRAARLVIAPVKTVAPAVHSCKGKTEKTCKKIAAIGCRGDVAAQVEASRPYREAVNEGRGGGAACRTRGVVLRYALDGLVLVPRLAGILSFLFEFFGDQLLLFVCWSSRGFVKSPVTVSNWHWVSSHYPPRLLFTYLLAVHMYSFSYRLG